MWRGAGRWAVPGRPSRARLAPPVHSTGTLSTNSAEQNRSACRSHVPTPKGEGRRATDTTRREGHQPEDWSTFTINLVKPTQLTFFRSLSECHTVDTSGVSSRKGQQEEWDVEHRPVQSWLLFGTPVYVPLFRAFPQIDQLQRRVPIEQSIFGKRSHSNTFSGSGCDQFDDGSGEGRIQRHNFRRIVDVPGSRSSRIFFDMEQGSSRWLVIQRS